jgi:predicted MFS family arabinose efflux permease
VLSFFLRYEETEAEEQKDEGHKTVFGKSGWIYIASQFLLFGAYNASLYVLPLQLHDLSFGDENYSLARSIAVAAELGMLLLMPLLSKLLRNKKTMLYIGMGLITVSTIFPCFVTNPWALAYGNLIVGHVGKAFLFAFEALFLIEVVGKESLGRMLAIKVGGYNFSTAVLNLLSGAVSQGWGYRGYFLLLLGMEVLGIALFVFVHPQKTNTIMPQKA